MRRLGLDIGTNSIGWTLFETKDGEVCEIVDIGVRIFSSGRTPNSDTSLAVERRTARSMRRQRDRYLRRRTSLMRKLSDAGLMPSNPVEAKALERLDPYELRSRALDSALPLTHFGRALFHLSQRRGFQSNRKIDQGDKKSNKEASKIREASVNLEKEMKEEGARTLGEFLHLRRQSALDPWRIPSVRTRLSVVGKTDKGKDKTGYQFYPDRSHIKEEFEKLWEAQARHSPELTDGLRAAVYNVIFFQRPLLPQTIGKCRFYDEERLAKAHPLTQRRILYETVNSLRIDAIGKAQRELTLEQRDSVIGALDNKKSTASPLRMEIKLKQLAKTLKLAQGESFSLESIHRDSIACDPVNASLSHPERFGPKWLDLNSDAQWEVTKEIKEIESADDFNVMVERLESHHGLPPENARETARAPLPAGYGALGETATRQILAKLVEKVIPYSDAVAACGMHHSDGRTGEVLEKLPYYGKILDHSVIPGTGEERDDDITRYGRITNPTVHIGLNQLRRLMNAIIETHGLPDEIVVEMARELALSKKQKESQQTKNRDNRKAAKLRSERLLKLNQADTGYNRMLMRLYEELVPIDGANRHCPYSGQPISEGMLFDGSCDVDHILPYSQTLDDSISNRTLCLKAENAEKGNRTPWKAWGGSKRWTSIAKNLKDFPKDKKWRFQPDAMKKFEKKNDFLARALFDTRYLSRVARQYLDALYTDRECVRAVPGRQTEMLRRNWGLNSLLSDREKPTVHQKNRFDHRHHAIDAAVVAATDRSLVQRMAVAAAKHETIGAEDVARSVDAPWEGFRDDLRAALDSIIVSHRVDHGRVDTSLRRIGRDSTSDILHNDTAYGIVSDKEVVSRDPLISLTAGQIRVTSKGKNIRDPHLQKLLEDATRGKVGKELEAALRDFSKASNLGESHPYMGIRRVRMIETLQRQARVEIRDADGNPYKAYKGDGNHCLELWKMPDGKLRTQVITTFEIHSDVFKRPHPAAKRILRLFKKDSVTIERDGQRAVFNVQSFAQSGQMWLAEHHEANADARNRDKKDSYKFLSLRGKAIAKAKLRRAHVDVMGRLRELGAVNYD